MTEVFDMDMNDLLGEDSQFIDGLKTHLENLGVSIDADALSTILHEYEITKMAFLKAYIMNLLESNGTNLNDEDGPVKVIVSNNGIDFDDIEQDYEEEDEIDTNIIS